MTRAAFAMPSDVLGFRMFTGRRRRSLPLHGIMLHTTGSGVPSDAGGDGKRALSLATKIYTGTGGPHYVIGWDGTIVATVADDDIAGAHAGITDADARQRYDTGGWESRVSPRSAQLWHDRWPQAKSPRDLVPGKNLSALNDLYIGIEMIPVTDGSRTWATPAYPGARFTQKQHDAARRLAHNIAKRHGFPSNWTSKTETRLVGHSDLNPIQRNSGSLPLWDPGYHIGLFNMEAVRKSSDVWLWLAGAAAAVGLVTAQVLTR